MSVSVPLKVPVMLGMVEPAVQSTSGAVTLDLTGTVSASGAVSLTLTDPTNSGNGATIAGHFSGGKITGTFVSTGDSGTFTVTKQ